MVRLEFNDVNHGRRCKGNAGLIDFLIVSVVVVVVVVRSVGGGCWVFN